MCERAVFFFCFSVNQHSMTLIEGAALGILPGKTNGISLQQHRTKSQRLREAVIDGALAVAHLRPLLEKLGDFGMHVKALWRANKGVGDFREPFAVQPSVRCVFGLETAAMVGRPVF